MTTAVELLLNVKAAAKLLGIAPRTLEVWRRAGHGPPFVRLGPRAIRYRHEAIEDWLRSRESLQASNRTPAEEEE